MINSGKPHQIANFEVATFSHWRFIKGKPQIWVAPLAQGHAYFSSACDFMMCLGKPKRHTKFEAASFIRCRNSKEEPQNFRKLPLPMITPTFLLGLILWWALKNLNSIPNLKSLASAVAKILKVNSKIWRRSPSPGPRPLLSRGILWWALVNPSACQIWSRWLYLLRKYKKKIGY